MIVKWRRLIFRGAVGAAALGVVAVAALPWWWPSVLALVGKKWGVSFEQSETHGWSTIEFRRVTYERDRVLVTAESVSVPAFGRWPGSGDNPAISARDVVVTLPQTSPPAVPPAPRPAARTIAADVMRLWSTLQEWLPRTRVERLALVAPARTVHVDEVRWDKTRLTLTGNAPETGGAFSAVVSRPDETTIHLEGAAPGRELRVTSDVRIGAEKLEVNAVTTWRENAATIVATFMGDDLLPSHATLKAPALAVPAAELGLAQYGDVQGAIDAEWSGQTYAATIAAHAAPLEASAELPPLEIDLRASGDLDSVRIDSALLRIPGVNANLSAPLALTLPSGVPQAPAKFSLDVELDKVPRSAARGHVSGTIEISGGPGAAPSVQFALQGEGIHWRDAEVSSLALGGRWQTGAIEVTRGEVLLGSDGFVRATGKLDLTARKLDRATIAARLNSSALHSWMPSLPEFAELVLDAEASGSWTQPVHHGKATWRELAGLPGGLIDGEASWNGDGSGTITTEAEVRSAAGITLPMQMEIARAPDGIWSSRVNRLAWQDAQGEWWHLAQPAEFAGKFPELRLTGLKLTGEKVALSVEAEVRWPAVGRVEVTGQSVAAARLTAFLPSEASAATLETFSLQAKWNDGPVQLDGAVRASYAPAEAQSVYAVEAQFRTESDTLAFGSLRVLDGSGVVLEGGGRLPVTVAGREDGFHFELPPDGRLELKLASTPNPPFWESLGRLIGWEIVEPRVQAELEGSLAAPRGHGEFTATSLQPPAGMGGTVQLPKLGEVKLVATADAGGLALSEGIWTIAEHWVSLQGHAPWSVWRDWRKQGTPPWRDVAFSFAADRMPMMIAARAVPTLLAPEGLVSFEMKHDPGRGFSGFLWLDDAALRPIQPVGAVRDIGGSVLLDGYKVTVEKLAAFLGGRPITIAGEGSIEHLDHPTFDLAVKSSRVPLVRQHGLVLRAGLDLRLQQPADRPAHISGTVDLGRSVYVSELISLLPTEGSVASPEQRPPFFSVAHEPFAQWTLDVHLQGEKFLRVENPFLTGNISADFQLAGTLAEPRAIGRAWTDNGAIIFPFGRFNVQQAEASLTRERPFDLALIASATTRVYGYNVRLEVSGTAQDPRLQFSSDPPLSSQQVFLMLSTGEIPDADQAFSTSARAQRIALFVGRNLASSLGLRGDGGEDRLTVRSGEDFSREGGETIYVQYDLDGRWSLVGEKDRFDAYNAGLRFRLIDR